MIQTSQIFFTNKSDISKKLTKTTLTFLAQLPHFLVHFPLFETRSRSCMTPHQLVDGLISPKFQAWYGIQTPALTMSPMCMSMRKLSVSPRKVQLYMTSLRSKQAWWSYGLGIMLVQWSCFQKMIFLAIGQRKNVGIIVLSKKIKLNHYLMPTS